LLEKKIKKIKKEYQKKRYILKKEYMVRSLNFILATSQVWYSKKILARHTRQLAVGKRRSKSYQTSVCILTGHYKSRINLGKMSRHSFKIEGDSNIFTNLHKKSK
jgi:hypothetical protein